MPGPSKTDGARIENNMIGFYVGVRRVQALDKVGFVRENFGHFCFRKGPILKTSAHGVVFTYLRIQMDRAFATRRSFLKIETKCILPV